MTLNLNNLNKSIINCNKCSRLIQFRKKILKNKRKQFKDEKYWGKPITGFGDINGKILFVGFFWPPKTVHFILKEVQKGRTDGSKK